MIPPRIGRQPWPCLWLVARLATFSLPVHAQFYDRTDPVMGSYQGFWSTQDGKRGRVTAQIRAAGDGAYDGFLLLEHSHQVVAALKLSAPAGAAPGSVTFTGSSAPREAGSELLAGVDVKAHVTGLRLTGAFAGELGPGSLEATHTNRKSPTLGAPPPTGAIRLFDGRDTSHWDHFHWKLTGDGAMEAQGSDLRVKDKLADFKLHLEFRTPFKPAARGQERGNS
ncbi:MAG: DUF1080 domain-containing protein, partial [Verrucomicrobia bacterium]|nr:DUF1080 domain-containing protein [Verrucomicrobiota bacterium]